jgi:hypothetical protein
VLLLLAHGLRADYPLVTTSLRQEIRAVWVDLQVYVGDGEGGSGSGSGSGSGGGVEVGGELVKTGGSDVLRERAGVLSAVRLALIAMRFEP